MYLANLSNGFAASDRRHRPLIQVVEWLARTLLNIALDLSCHILAHLNRDRSHTWQVPIVLLESHEIPDDEDFAMPRYIGKFIHQHAPCAIGLTPKSFA